MSAYNYLATLRLHDGHGGRTLTVGPSRRVVFKNRIGGRVDLRKDEVKRVLKSLYGYWGNDQRINPGPRDPDRPMMTFMQFKMNAKALLKAAGLLLECASDDAE